MRIPFVVAEAPHNLPKMQIRRCLSLRWWLISGLFFLISIGIAFSWGQYLGQQTMALPAAHQSEFKQYLEKLNYEHARLKQLVQVTSVNLAIEKNAQRHLLERLNTVESENAGLKQELNFFVKLRRNNTGSKS